MHVEGSRGEKVYEILNEIVCQRIRNFFGTKEILGKRLINILNLIFLASKGTFRCGASWSSGLIRQ